MLQSRLRYIVAFGRSRTKRYNFYVAFGRSKTIRYNQDNTLQS